MYYFYVLYSLKDQKLYKGFSSDIGKRFLKHQAGGTPSTKHRRPMVLIYLETYPKKEEALRRERETKTPEGGIALVKQLIHNEILTEDRKLQKS
ncbi:MAG TPA: GIY-YIG nuclease family protein [Saprospiraceae bacterium]|nr:GIY-YIG nuclease family protein [Saprospiraceae bacterium]